MLTDPRRRKAVTGVLIALVAVGVVVLVGAPLRNVGEFGDRPLLAACVAIFMAVLWLTEAIPIAWTAALPIVLFPALGVFGPDRVVGAKQAVLPYGDAYILLFLGGMAIGAAMEQHGLHRRVALFVLSRIGTTPLRLLLGVLLTTALISLWISNTATAVMMTPIAVALLAEMQPQQPGADPVRFKTAVMLAIAYGANVGGIGTKIGSGTNSIFAGYLSERLSIEISFVRYSLLALPFVLLFLPVVNWVLARHAKQDILTTRGPSEQQLAEMRKDLGAMVGKERRVAFVFGTAALLWILSDPIKQALRGPISELLSTKLLSKHIEAAVGVLAILLLLSLRSLGISAIKRIPFGTLVLLGGSFSLAAGIEQSGLGQVMSRALAPVAELPLFTQIAVASVCTVVLTALASNTAAINIALTVLPPTKPVLGAALLAASCDFALPAGTPPNAIIFASGHVRLPTMMKVGAQLDLLAALVIALYMFVLGRHLF